MSRLPARRAPALQAPQAPAPTAPAPVQQHPPVCEERLRLALRHLRRPGWPSTLEACMAKPHYALALRALAQMLNRGGQPLPARPPHALPKGLPVPGVPAQPLPPGAPAHLLHKAPAWALLPPASVARGAADRKRLAANDIDTDTDAE